MRSMIATIARLAIYGLRKIVETQIVNIAKIDH